MRSTRGNLRARLSGGWRSGLAAIFAAALCVSACTRSPDGQVYADLTGLVPVPSSPAGVDAVYRRPGVDFKRYDRLQVEEAQFVLRRASRQGDINEADRTYLKRLFFDELVEALEERYPIVQNAGPSVLRVRIALTELTPSRFMAAGDLRSQQVGVDLGKAAVEVQLYDSQTMQLLAVATDRQGGGVGTLAGKVSKWSEAQAAFRTWSVKLRASLDRLRTAT